MIKPKTMVAIFCLAISPLGFSQVEELTPEEQAYKDSITALNLENEAITNSQEAYNNGIQLFGDKNYGGAI
ncbi:MAG: hypothetical protein JKY09_06925, partial [Crocinitomicaceae bacterium]|nr:hypothetical protein [Crocinitomicaceae bacterium]